MKSVSMRTHKLGRQGQADDDYDNYDYDNGAGYSGGASNTYC